MSRPQSECRCSAILEDGRPCARAARPRPIDGKPRCVDHAPRLATRGDGDAFVEVDLSCACGVEETMTLPATEPVSEVMARVVCARCGVLGRMRFATAPPSSEAYP